MFEKEAEFYAKEKYSPKTDSFIVAVADDAFKDGAEFGFKKGIKAKINTTTISDCPIKDEWHKVTNWKDNSQFPDDESETYLVCLYQNHYVVCEVDVTEGYREFWLEDNLESIDPQDVVAWKEIVPPKETENA